MICMHEGMPTVKSKGLFFSETAISTFSPSFRSQKSCNRREKKFREENTDGGNGGVKIALESWASRPLDCQPASSLLYIHFGYLLQRTRPGDPTAGKDSQPTLSGLCFISHIIDLQPTAIIDLADQ